MSGIQWDVWRLVLVLICVLVNGFFVAAEYALVSVRRTRMQELAENGSRRAKLVNASLNHLSRFVSATQVGVTMASLVVGALGEPAFAHLIKAALGDGGAHAQVSDVVDASAVILAFLVITYLHVVVGELVPKSLALGKSERVVLATIMPMRFLVRVAQPLIAALNFSAARLGRLVGVAPPNGMHPIHSEEELKMLVSQSSEGGVLEDTEQEMLYNVFDFADKDVAEVMVPRPDVVCIGLHEAPAELMQRIISEPYTRYPVYRESMDDIAGILHIRDLFAAAERFGKDRVRVESLLRPAHVVPESKSLAGLLADFRRSKSHMALVVDEYGSLSGIVTMEDLIEEIVGDIDDEHDVPDEPVERLGENHLRVDGKFPIDELEERFGFDLPSDDYHTIGGFVFGLLGQQPHEGDVVRWQNLRIEVTETDGPRIVHVDIFISPGHKGKGDAADHDQHADSSHDGNGSRPSEHLDTSDRTS